MRIFKNKSFTRFAKKAGIGDAGLCRAISDAERRLIAADLGGGLIKQRIARLGQKERDNIQSDQLVALRKLAAELLAYDDETMARVVASGTLTEVMCIEKTIP